MVVAPTPAAVKSHGELVPTGNGAPIALIRPRLRLGRRESCDICLPYPNVSGLHCELVFHKGRWTIRDLNSTNGVKVNGARILEKLLHPGDRISIGKRDYTIKYTLPVDPVPCGSRPEDPLGG
jgi:adenylate cyclase